MRILPLLPSALPLLEPVNERRRRRFILFAAFLIAYLACIPLWWRTSRVQRVALDHNTFQYDPHSHHTIPIHLHFIETIPASDNWSSRAYEQVKSQLSRSNNQTHLIQWELQPIESNRPEIIQQIQQQAGLIDNPQGNSTPSHTLRWSNFHIAPSNLLNKVMAFLFLVISSFYVSRSHLFLLFFTSFAHFSHAA